MHWIGYLLWILTIGVLSIFTLLVGAVWSELTELKTTPTTTQPQQTEEHELRLRSFGSHCIKVMDGNRVVTSYVLIEDGVGKAWVTQDNEPVIMSEMQKRHLECIVRFPLNELDTNWNPLLGWTYDATDPQDTSDNRKLFRVVVEYLSRLPAKNSHHSNAPRNIHVGPCVGSEAE